MARLTARGKARLRRRRRVRLEVEGLVVEFERTLLKFILLLLTVLL
jgi:hypothetical protein